MILRTASVMPNALLLAAAALALAAPAVEAQLLTGQVREGSSDRVIADAALTLLHPDGRTLGEPVLSNSEGRFRLEVPGPGQYYLRTEKLGYTPLTDGIFAFESADGRLNVTVYLVPRPVDLEGLEVIVDFRKIRRNLRRAGFYERADAGFGYFVGPEQIKAREAFNLSDHIRHVPGLRYRDGRVLFRTNPGPYDTVEEGLCEPVVFLDGAQLINGTINPFGPISGQGLDDRVPADNVVGIEVYRRLGEIPLQFFVNAPGMPFCGAIVVWTESGR